MCGWIMQKVLRDGHSDFGCKCNGTTTNHYSSAESPRKNNFGLHPFVILILLSLILGGCGNHFAQSVKYDTGKKSEPGTITISDPKLYSRELLINERAREIARIQKLIDKADSIEFKPDIIREVEQIRAFSASLGLKIDPAAGLNYRRAQETGDIQQEISVLRLQLQLEQLRRDAELMRSKLQEQTEPVNAELGKVTANAPTAAAITVTTASVEQLKAQIERLLDAMKTQFGTEAKPAAPTSVGSNPFDVFRDRQAYLDMLRSARNAAALDELHDLDSSALIRLNFHATVVPDPEQPRSLGAVQVKVNADEFDKKAKQQFLSEWLDHINIKSETRTADGKFNPNSEAITLQRLGLISIVEAGKYQFAFPASSPNGTVTGLAADFREAEWEKIKKYEKSNDLISSWNFDQVKRTPVFTALCKSLLTTNLDPNSLNRLREDAHAARMRVLTYQYMKKIDSWLTTLRQKEFAPDLDKKYSDAKEFVRNLLSILEQIQECKEEVSKWPNESPEIAWNDLLFKLGEKTEVRKARIYEVGPREQVQQMSTVARTANSLALAASIAASIPNSGAAADAMLGYTRQAMGRATTLERVPSVVGYTVGDKQTFGWIICPRASLDPKGRIDVEQMLKPYDLSVDMSVPAWWPSLKLKITSLWAPSPQNLTRGELQLNGDNGADMEIPLPHRTPDFDWFTQQLTGQEGPLVTIEKVDGGPVNACTPTTLYVTGTNVWRTDKVLVLDQFLDSDAITIDPSMRGIFLKVPAIQPLTGRKNLLKIFTPFSPQEYKEEIKYVAEPSGDGCKQKKAEAEVDPDKPVIDKIIPDLFFTLPGSFDITVYGKNLDKITRVTIDNQKSTLTPAGGTSLTISFAEKDTTAIPPGDNIPLVFYWKKNSDSKENEVASKSVRITHRGGN